jgi:hypothetical protein
MANYRHHPERSYGIEIRDGWSEDDYIANARGFTTTADFLEYRDATPERQAEIRDRSNRGTTSATDDGDLMRYAAFLNLKAK